jgi:hypothetical protein
MRRSFPGERPEMATNEAPFGVIVAAGLLATRAD